MSYEKINIEHTNKKWFWNHLNTEEEVNEVCEYLKENNLKIELVLYHEGCNIYLEGIDLSGNGCCFRSENLLIHVRYFRKMQEISKSEDFVKWLMKYPYYDVIRRNIIEKDQRWNALHKIEEIVNKFNAE